MNCRASILQPSEPEIQNIKVTSRAEIKHREWKFTVCFCVIFRGITRASRAKFVRWQCRKWGWNEAGVWKVWNVLFRDWTSHCREGTLGGRIYRTLCLNETESYGERGLHPDGWNVININWKVKWESNWGRGRKWTPSKSLEMSYRQTDVQAWKSTEKWSKKMVWETSIQKWEFKTCTATKAREKGGKGQILQNGSSRNRKNRKNGPRGSVEINF